MTELELLRALSEVVATYHTRIGLCITGIRFAFVEASGTATAIKLPSQTIRTSWRPVASVPRDTDVAEAVPKDTTTKPTHRE